jgi:hypothetical protein
LMPVVEHTWPSWHSEVRRGQPTVAFHASPQRGRQLCACPANGLAEYPAPVNGDQCNQVPKRKRVSRGLLAFLWLTVGYGLFSVVVPLVLLFLPFAHSNGGIEVSSEQGVHHVRFPGSPGDVVAVLFVSSSGPKDIAFRTPSDSSLSGSTHMEYSNGLLQLILVALFALISIPVLRRVFRNETGNV